MGPKMRKSWGKPFLSHVFHALKYWLFSCWVVLRLNLTERNYERNQVTFWSVEQGYQDFKYREFVKLIYIFEGLVIYWFLKIWKYFDAWFSPENCHFYGTYPGGNFENSQSPLHFSKVREILHFWRGYWRLCKKKQITSYNIKSKRLTYKIVKFWLQLELGIAISLIWPDFLIWIFSLAFVIL